jgi:uncharacterized membrane protein
MRGCAYNGKNREVYVDEKPSLFNRKSLSRASAAGVGLALLGIVLFVVLWVILGTAGVETFARLLVSLCLPPAIIAGLIGGYVLLARPADGGQPKS